MYLILWETNPSLYPLDPGERMKLTMSQMEMTKKDIDSGNVKMWGISAGGGNGFAITDDDPKTSFEKSMMYTPYVKFEIRPMLSMDEAANVVKGMQK